MSMKRSDVTTIFKTKTFSEWKKTKEGQSKLTVAHIERLDSVIRAVSNLGKALTSTRSAR